MSDVLSDVNMYLSEPDETVLTAALRNKDDIPILMDIVGDDTPLVSQEEHLQSSVAIDPEVRPVTAKKETTLKRPLSPATTIATPVQPSAEQAAFRAAKSALEPSQTPAQSATQATVNEVNSETLTHASTSADLLSEVIQTVLERKLPEIVEEVMLEIAKREQR